MVIVTVTLNTSVDRTVEVPRFAVGGHLRGMLRRVQPAGKGVNVSRCLARLGVTSIVAGFVGAGEVALFRDSFVGTPASIALVPVTGATRTNTTILDPVLGTDTHVREAGFHILPHEIDGLESRLRELSAPEALVVFCGSLPPGVTVAHLSTLMAVCKERGAQMAADLNGPHLGVAIEAEPLLVKPNVQELGGLLGADLAGADAPALVGAARGLCDRVGTVLLTRGEAGTLAVTADEALAASVHVDGVRNTVGCGDAALAGYLAGLWRGDGPEECLASAVACGAASALTEAAGDLDPGRIAELRERVVVGRL